MSEVADLQHAAPAQPTSAERICVAQSARMPASPLVVFDAWAEHKMLLEKGGCSEDSIPIYRAIWEGWLRWLTTQDLPEGEGAAWTRARSQHVRCFIDGPAPAVDKRRRVPKNELVMANYTRQRYWSVLRGIYAFACVEENGWCQVNPAQDCDLDERPRIAARDREAQVLPVGVLALLRDPAQLQRLLPKSADSQWWIDRDRALMALLVHFGLTKRELIDLQGRDLRAGAAPFNPRGTARMDVEQLPVMLDVRKVGSHTLRQGAPFAVPDVVLAQLEPWLMQRHRILERQRVRLLTQKAATARVQVAADVELPLFLARIPGEDGCLPKVEDSTVYQLVNRCLSRAYATDAVRQTLATGAVIAKGPAIVRNAVVRDWIEKLGPVEAAHRAGLGSIRSLRHPVPATS